ncbi:hypothetical protein [Lonepinella sp. MS14437]|uniref:hypothetical protein n=1 Tax=Lonepinella sp. MS14437 TaxID=3003620 RepID=UPI0036DF93E8
MDIADLIILLVDVEPLHTYTRSFWNTHPDIKFDDTLLSPEDFAEFYNKGDK